MSPDGELKIAFGRDLYWPDNLAEIKQFMPTYVYIDPELAALEDLKQKIQAEQLSAIASSGGKVEDNNSEAVDNEDVDEFVAVEEEVVLECKINEYEKFKKKNDKKNKEEEEKVYVHLS